MKNFIQILKTCYKALKNNSRYRRRRAIETMCFTLLSIGGVFISFWIAGANLIVVLINAVNIFMMISNITFEINFIKEIVIDYRNYWYDIMGFHETDMITSYEKIIEF